jgi:pumilio RNA-binding family
LLLANADNSSPNAQNYVIQFLLENGEPQDRAGVISRLHGQMLSMARHKFASNVVEKALVTADAASRRLLVEELMVPKVDGASPMAIMMKDQYASACLTLLYVWLHV